MSVSILASSPPVQDSAVVTVGDFRFRFDLCIEEMRRRRCGSVSSSCRRSDRPTRRGRLRSFRRVVFCASSREAKRALMRSETMPCETVVPTEGFRSRLHQVAELLGDPGFAQAERVQRAREDHRPAARLLDVREDVAGEHDLHFLRHAGHDEDAGRGFAGSPRSAR